MGLGRAWELEDRHRARPLGTDGACRRADGHKKNPRLFSVEKTDNPRLVFQIYGLYCAVFWFDNTIHFLRIAFI